MMTIPPVNAHPLPTAPSAQPRVRGHDVEAGRSAFATRAAPAHEARVAGRGDLLSADAPSGTDPMLWSVLTSEERAFFARAHALGGVTYGPGAATRAAGVPRGGRVDVRV